MSQDELLSLIRQVLEGIPLPKEEEEEVESWLDWGLGLIKEWGPKALEMAPTLLALL
jgi:hypothetical protein